MNDREMNYFTNFWTRSPGEWWLGGVTLIYWLSHRKLKFNPMIAGNIETSCSKKRLKEYCFGRGVIFNEDEYGIVTLNFGFGEMSIDFKELNSNIVASEEEKEKLKRHQSLSAGGLWQQNIDPLQPYRIQLPFRYGTILDKLRPLWWKGLSHVDYTPQNVWFTSERKQRGYELLGLILDCAERAGIRDAFFLGFGNLLGYVMLGDFIPCDTDMDMCIMMDRSTPEKDRKYLEEIKKPFEIDGQKFPHGLCEKEYRFSNFRDDENRPLWVSVGPRSIMRDNGVKSCHWWMFEHSNYYWHSKGDHWVQPGKFQNQLSIKDKALCLGQPADTLEKFVEVNFHGVPVNMPAKAGTCLDWWYPGWCLEGKGASAKHRVLAVQDWKNKATWRFL